VSFTMPVNVLCACAAAGIKQKTTKATRLHARCLVMTCPSSAKTTTGNRREHVTWPESYPFAAPDQTKILQRSSPWPASPSRRFDRLSFLRIRARRENGASRSHLGPQARQQLEHRRSSSTSVNRRLSNNKRSVGYERIGADRLEGRAAIDRRRRAHGGDDQEPVVNAVFQPSGTHAAHYRSRSLGSHSPASRAM